MNRLMAFDLDNIRKRIKLDEGIREVGTYMVEVEVPGGATASVKTIVAEAR